MNRFFFLPSSLLFVVFVGSVALSSTALGAPASQVQGQRLRLLKPAHRNGSLMLKNVHQHVSTVRINPKSTKAKLLRLLQGHHVSLYQMKKACSAPNAFSILVAIAKDQTATVLLRSRAMSLLRLFPQNRLALVFKTIVLSPKTPVLLKNNAFEHLVAVAPTQAKPLVPQLLNSPQFALREAAIRSLKQHPKWIHPEVIRSQYHREKSSFLKMQLLHLLQGKQIGGKSQKIHFQQPKPRLKLAR